MVHEDNEESAKGQTQRDPFAAELDAAVRDHELGKLEEAAAAYRSILDKAPEHPDALHLLGLATLQRGDPKGAATLIGQAIAASPDSAPFHNNLGSIHRTLGHVPEAIECFRRAIALSPAYAQAHNNVGLALHQAGDPDGAVNAYEKALEYDPAYAEAHNNLGLIYESQGRLDDALASFRRAVAADADNSEAHNNVGSALTRLQELDSAAWSFREAIRLAPDYPLPYLNLADVHRRHGDLAAAEAVCREAVENVPGAPHGHAKLAEVLRRKGQLDESVAALRTALEIDPLAAPLHNDLGVNLLIKGEFEEAERSFELALSLAPGLAVAYENLARSRKFNSDDRPLVARLDGLAQDPSTSPEVLVALQFALGKLHDDLGEHEQAFAQVQRANQSMRAVIEYDAASYRRWVDRVIEVFEPPLFVAKRALGDESEVPVFIVGMPRSGTTLVEQILSSHPEFHGAGELNYFDEFARPEDTQPGSPALYPDEVATLDDRGAQAVADAYRTRLRRNAPDTARRISDKTPVNFQYLGLIAMLFPASRIVVCRREPRDVSLSIFFHHFTKDHPYAYDLYEIGAYYRDSERLVEHWRHVLPVAIHEVDYEKLVMEPEANARALVEFCGLDWDQRCLAHTDNPRPVGTASHWQVRQPIYRDAVGRWQHYRAHLGELERGLSGR